MSFSPLMAFASLIDGFTDALTNNYGETIKLDISRQGELISLDVELAQPQDYGESWAFHQSPWKNTAPTDWSSLSAANITAQVQQQQRAQQQMQAAYEQGLRDAERQTSTYSYTSSIDTCQSHDSRSQRRTSASGGCGEYREFKQAYSKQEVKDWLINNGDGWDPSDWTVSAPNTYDHLFKYPAFVQ